MPMAGKCLPGTYTGTFSCTVDMGFGIKTEYTGPVSFVLTSSPSGEFLEISNGTLGGTGNGIPFMADLNGKLDCTTNEFSATTANGTYIILIFSGQFSGSLDGRLDRLTQTLAGMWTLVPLLGGTATGGASGAGGAAAQPFTCPGTWSVVRQ